MTAPAEASYLQRKFIQPLKNILTMGITPQKLAVTLALGIVIGIMPLFGPITLLCTVFSIRFKLNLPAMLTICYLMGPLHIALYIPFIQLGLYVFDFISFKLSFDQVRQLFEQDWLLALKTIWLANLAGVLAWLVLAGPLTYICYLLLLPVLRKLIKRRQAEKLNLSTD